MDAALIRTGSDWNAQAIDAFLASALIPLRLACVTDSGRPLICSLWYLADSDSLWCATQDSARIVDYFERNPACAFEIAPETMPYKGVRGQGRAIVRPDEGSAVLGRLIDRYFGNRDSDFAQWLLSRAEHEVALQIQPDWLTAWDFSGRMDS